MVAFFVPPLAGSPLEFTFVASATADSTTVTIPASAALNDIAVIIEWAVSDEGTSTLGVPSGWTSVKLQNSPSPAAMGAYRKTLGAGEGGTNVTTGTTSTDPSTIIMIVFRPTRAVGSVTASTWNGQGAGTGSPALQTVSASGQATPLIVIAAGGSWDLPTPPSFNFSVETPAFEGEVANTNPGGSFLRVGYTIYNVSALDQSVDIGDHGDWNSLISGYLQFT